MTNIASALTGILLCITGGAPAAAQDSGRSPEFGTIFLRAGFTPDPRIIAVRAAGTIDMSRRPSCVGLITAAPAVRLNYEKSSLPLIVSVDAAVDTTLVIAGPDGTWHCNDNAGPNTRNPRIRFNRPASGGYDIWVDLRRPGVAAQARLQVSEIDNR